MDVSTGGVRLLSSRPMPVGSEIRVDLDEDAKVTGVGTVVWCQTDDSSWALGISWQFIRAESQAALSAYLATTVGGLVARRCAREAMLQADGFATTPEQVNRIAFQRTRTVRSILTVASVLVLGLGLGFGAQHFGILEGTELRLLDARQRILPARRLSDKMALILIDDAALRHFGWPFPRSVHAQLVKILSDAKAPAIVFDILFADQDAVDPKNDQALSAVAKRAACLSFPSGFSAATKATGAAERDEPRLPVVEVERPIESLAKGSTLKSHLHAFPNADGVYRSVPLLLDAGGETIPSVGLAAYLCATAPANLRGNLTSRSGAGVRVQDTARRPWDIPLDSNGMAWLAFRSSLQRSGAISVLDFLAAYKTAKDAGREQAFLAQYAGKIVLIGQSARSFGDWGATPLEPSAPLALVHATLIDNLVRQGFIWRPHPAVQIGLTLLVCLLVAGVATRVRSWRGGLLALAVLGVYALTAIAVFWAAQLWLDVAVPIAAAFVVLVGLLLAQALEADASDRLIRSAFGAFVSPAILQRILLDPSQLDVVGHKSRIAVVFTDIQGYTSLWNTFAPRDMLSFLREYLSEMSRLILAHSGTIDKIMGDGIMCFFGDPVVSDDFAIQAAQATLDMQAAMHGLQRSWTQRGLPTMQIRIGIATGEVYVGNVGTPQHIEYTAVGQAVNLASRLESKAKAGGILVCRETAALLAEQFVVEEDAPVNLKGFDEPYRPFRLCGRKR